MEEIWAQPIQMDRHSGRFQFRFNEESKFCQCAWYPYMLYWVSSWKPPSPSSHRHHSSWREISQWLDPAFQKEGREGAPGLLPLKRLVQSAIHFWMRCRLSSAFLLNTIMIPLLPPTNPVCLPCFWPGSISNNQPSVTVSAYVCQSLLPLECKLPSQLRFCKEFPKLN